MVHKYFLKTFYSKTIKKDYDLQIRQHNIKYTNKITMKDMIILAKKSRDNKQLLAIEKIEKTIMAKSVKVLSFINVHGKYNLAISNNNIDAVKDLKLTNI